MEGAGNNCDRGSGCLDKVDVRKNAGGFEVSGSTNNPTGEAIHSVSSSFQWFTASALFSPSSNLGKMGVVRRRDPDCCCDVLSSTEDVLMVADSLNFQLVTVEFVFQLFLGPFSFRCVSEILAIDDEIKRKWTKICQKKIPFGRLQSQSEPKGGFQGGMGGIKKKEKKERAGRN